MDNMHRSRLLGRILIIGVVTVVAAALVVMADVYTRQSTKTVHTAGSTQTQTVPGTPIPASPQPAPTASPSPQPDYPIPSVSLVADVMQSSIDVYGQPAVGKVLASLPDVNAMNQREALLVIDSSVPGWYKVEVPVRPNGSEGWVAASGVSIRQVNDYIRVYQSQFLLQWYVNGQLQKSFEVAVGAPNTPTPYGSYYVWASENYNHAPYTPGIFALSAFSPVLENWPGGGRTGIHGWTDTSVVGHRASHGCVRMRPADFAQLLNTVPLGTPVDILS